MITLAADSNVLLSVVIPCYNEAANISLLISRIRDILACEREREKVEFILVNNGSTDDSSSVFAREMASGSANIRILELPINIGYGHGITEGLRIARGQALAWTHADLQTDPADALRAWHLYRQKSADDRMVLVKGNRCKRRWSEMPFGVGMSIVATAVLGKSLFDVNAQPKVFPRAFFETLSNPPFDYSLDLYVLYQARLRGLTFYGIDVTFGQRLHGESKWSFSVRSRIRMVWRTFKYIVALRRYRPASDTTVQKRAQPPI